MEDDIASIIKINYHLPIFLSMLRHLDQRSLVHVKIIRVVTLYFYFLPIVLQALIEESNFSFKDCILRFLRNE